MVLDIHQTDNPDVARMAVAWEIVSRAVSATGANNSSFGAAVEDLTDKYIQVYNAILANEQKPGTEYHLNWGDKPPLSQP